MGALLGLAKIHYQTGNRDQLQALASQMTTLRKGQKNKNGQPPAEPSPDFAPFLPDPEWINSVRQHTGS